MPPNPRPSKQERMKKAFETFLVSEQGAGDYLQLFIIVRDVVTQGSGLLWVEMLDILKAGMDPFRTIARRRMEAYALRNKVSIIIDTLLEEGVRGVEQDQWRDIHASCDILLSLYAGGNENADNRK